MTPHDVAAADLDLLVRFQAEIAYGDGAPRTAQEKDQDLDLLLSGDDGAKVVAWLWPDLSYTPDFDPFDATSDPRRDDPAAVRQGRADLLRAVLVSTAQTSSHSLEDVKTHVKWATQISARELDQLLAGEIRIPLLPPLFDALQLNFKDTWVHADREGLRNHIDHSLLAAAISAHLHNLTTENLQALLKKLPQGSAGPRELREPETYLAPPTSSRYRPLYEALAEDGRDTAHYAVSAINDLIRLGGHPGLPKSSLTDGSWWAGTGGKAAGRPQVRAWWAAGYRIQRVLMAGDEVVDIIFEALPGRKGWLEDTDRIDKGEYRMPGPLATPIDLSLAHNSPIQTPSTETAAEIPPSKQSSHDDPAVQQLVDLLRIHGEGDRTLIENHLREHVAEDLSPQAITNLLTKAKRRGLITNYGSRSQPRWVAAGSKGDIVLEVAKMLDLQVPHVGAGDELPNGFMRSVAEATGINPPSSLSDTAITRSILKALRVEWREGGDGTATAFPITGLRKLRDAIKQHTTQGRTDRGTTALANPVDE